MNVERNTVGEGSRGASVQGAFIGQREELDSYRGS